MGPETAKEFKESSVIGKVGGVVIPFPGKMEKEVEPVKKETSREYKERMGRSRRRKAWILLGTLGPPAVTEATLEAIHDTGHAEIIPWYDSFRDKVVNSVKSFFVKTPEGEVIGTINTTPETRPPETTSSLPVASETTQETTPPTTQETTAPAETTPQTVEYKGVIFTLPEWSEANPQTGEIFALVGNLYGVEAGTKIGQCIIDAVELDGKMVNSEAFIPPVIEYMQKKIMEKDKEFRFPLPFDFQIAKQLKIDELNFLETDEKFWNEPKSLAISNIPEGTKIFAPLSTDKGVVLRNAEINSGWYLFIFYAKNMTGGTFFNELYFKDKRIDIAEVHLYAIGVKIPKEIEAKIPSGGDVPAAMFEPKIGLPIATIVRQEALDLDIYKLEKRADEENQPSLGYSVIIDFQMGQFDLEDAENKYPLVGKYQSGKDNLLKSGNLIVSIMSVND